MFNDVNVEGQSISLTAGADGEPTSTIGTATAAIDVEITRGSIVAQGPGDIYLDATEGSSLNVENIDSRLGSLYFSAIGEFSGGSITEASDVALGTAVATGNSITLSADPLLGTIGSPTQSFEIDVRPNGTLTSSSGLDQYITQPTGNLALNTVTTSNGGTAFIEVPDGSISTGNTGGENILAGATYLFASNNIGTSSDPMTTSVGNVQGQSTTGNTYVVNNTGVTVGGVNPDDDMGLDSGGLINLMADGPVMTMQSVMSGGNTKFTATNDCAWRHHDRAGCDRGVNDRIGGRGRRRRLHVRRDQLHPGAQGTITIAGDYDDPYGDGMVITIDGSISAPTITIDGNGASAVLNLNNPSGINTAPGRRSGF